MAFHHILQYICLAWEGRLRLSQLSVLICGCTMCDCTMLGSDLLEDLVISLSKHLTISPFLSEVMNLV